MVTSGKTATGRPICRLLKPQAYFETYNEAYAALVDHNKNPYDIEKDITIAELHERWSKEKYTTLESTGSISRLRSAWANCRPLYSMKVKDVRIRHMKACIEEAQTTPHIKIAMKTIFNEIFDYALEYEITEHNYARDFAISKGILASIEETEKGHIPFTKEEMEILWSNLDKHEYQVVDFILIQCYSGWRPGELCKMQIKDIDLQKGYIIGGSKTDAGKNRIVPIHSIIKPLILKRISESTNGFLFDGVQYKQLRLLLMDAIPKLGLNPNHRLHDGRVHFTTMAKKYGVDEYALKMMLGHKINDITEEVYTKREFSWLAEEIEKIK